VCLAAPLDTLRLPGSLVFVMVLTSTTRQLDPDEDKVEKGGPQGGPSDGPPQPPAPNTNGVLSVPEHLSVTLVGLGGLAHPKPWPTSWCGFGEISPPAERINGPAGVTS
jgi:hypothetical protein